MKDIRRLPPFVPVFLALAVFSMLMGCGTSRDGGADPRYADEIAKWHAERV
jgi:hypothetical protein